MRTSFTRQMHEHTGEDKYSLIMSGKQINLAIIRSKAKVVWDSPNVLEKVIAKKKSQDGEYQNVTCEVVAWEEPNDWERYTILVLSSGIDYTDCFDKFASWLDGLPLFVGERVVNSRNIIKWNMDKKYLLDLKQKGVKISPTVIIEQHALINPNDLIRELRNQENRPVTQLVVKHRIDADGHSAKVVTLEKTDIIGAKELQLLHEESSKNSLIVQTFLSSIQVEGEWSAVYFDRKLSHCVIKNPTKGDFRVQARFGGQTLLVEIQDVPNDVLELSKYCIEVVPKNENLLYARVDIARDNHGEPCLMELELFEPDLFIFNNELANNFLRAVCKYAR